MTPAPRLRDLALGAALAIAAAPLPGCSPTTGAAAEKAALGIATAACDAFLPLAASYLPAALAPLAGTPVCAGAEALVAGALAAAVPSPPPASPVGASELPSRRLLLAGGRPVALVPVAYMGAPLHARAQAYLDGRR